jgi:hypothetical protein
MRIGSVVRKSFLAALFAMTLGTPASAITADAFRMRTGADLVALCTTPADDPLYAAAIHMCHGFGAGTYQTIQAMTRHEKLTPLFCPPETQMTRNDAIRIFVEWAKSNSQYLPDPPVELLGRFLVERFPCAAK